MVIFWPSSRLQVIFGNGFPAALQANEAFPPSLTVTSDMVSASLISGGTITKMNNKIDKVIIVYQIILKKLEFE